MIPFLVEVQKLRDVPIENGSDAYYAVDPAGGRWVAKPTLGANQVVAEAIGWELSRALSVPTPDAACVGPVPVTWLSSALPHVAHWDAADVFRITNMDDLGRMLALDVLIGNWDRHVGNILLTPDDGPGLKVYSIDVANAWVGDPSDLAEHSNEAPPVDRLVEGIPVELTHDPALDLARRAGQLSPAFIQEVVSSACILGGRSVKIAEAIASLLEDRCRDAERLTTGYFQLLGARR